MHPVVKTEGQPRQVFVDQRTQVRLHVVRRVKKVLARNDARDSRQDANGQDQDHVVVQGVRAVQQTFLNGGVE
jgi:hypothetical protein